MLRQNLRTACELAVHDFRVRYARSAAGWVWLIMTPAGLLALYGIVFGIVLKVRWPALDSGEPVGFITPFFCGLTVFLFFSDVVSSSVGLFHSKRNYVKRSPFPLWVIWAANYLRACIQGAAYLLLLLAMAVVQGVLTISGLLFAALALVAIVAACAAISLVLAAVGPFLGDLAEAVRVVLRLVFYAAPVTYPLALVPADWRFLLWFNPLTHMIEPLRSAIVYGQPGMPLQLLGFAVAAAVALAAFWWLFDRVSEAVPDVV